MVNNATRFDVSEGRIEYDGVVIALVGNRPLIHDDLWTDNRLEFIEGYADISDDMSAVPDDLRQKLDQHGYWPQ